MSNAIKKEERSVKKARYSYGITSWPFHFEQDVIEAVNWSDLVRGLRRFLANDWGDVGEWNRIENARVLREGEGTVFSSYADRNGKRFWVLGNADLLFASVRLATPLVVDPASV